MKEPAALGGRPTFPDLLPIARPSLPPLERIMERVRASYERGILTNGPLVRELEELAAARFRVQDVVAVSSCTAGLMLVLQAVAGTGPVLLPSFTFSASAHAVAWNGRTPVFVECDPDTFQFDTADGRRAAAESGAVGAVLATHVFGAPCAAEEVEKLGHDLGVSVVFDAAHAFGATREGRPVGGFGAAEVFSLSPTKPVVAGEGGLVATDDRDLAETLRWGRDYGNPGDYDTRFPGLNGRMSELHAATALESLAGLDETLEQRGRLARRYREALATVPGLRFQHLPPEDTSTFKDLTISVDAGQFGMARDTLVEALRAEGIETRRYFWPPVHRHQAYAGTADRPLEVTDRVAASVVSLPMFNTMRPGDIDQVAEAIIRITERAEELEARLAR